VQQVDSSSSGGGGELMSAALAQRMNTEVRKNIFCVIMGSEDCVDAFQR